MLFGALLKRLTPRTGLRPSPRANRRQKPPRLGLQTLDDRITPAGAFYVDDAWIVEGNSGSLNAVIPVRLVGQHGNKVTVNYKTVAGTADAGTADAAGDYTDVIGKLTFNKNQTRKNVIVPIIGDRALEDYENFTLELFTPKGATIADGSGTATISDNEPRVHVDDAWVGEGNADATTMTFTVRLQSAYDMPVTVNYATDTGGTATEGDDYVAASGTVIIPAFQSSATFQVPVNDDLIVEQDETILVNVTTPDWYATIGDGAGVGTIYDNEPRITIYDGYQDYYGSTITFYVYLTAASDDVVTVDFNTWDGYAVAGSDYVATSGTITFNPGETMQSFTVDLLNIEPDPYKYFSIQLSNPNGNATLANDWATGYWYYDWGYWW